MEKHNLKYIYLTLAAVTAAGVWFIPNATWAGAAVMIAVCLMTAFFSPEKVEDERVEHLKLKALRIALVVSGFVVFGQAWLAKGLGRGVAIYYLSAFDLLIIAMLIALGLFHWWRWQDGREVPPE